MGFKGNKSSLPRKTCLACGREMSRRKSWAKNWAEVNDCSQACRAIDAEGDVTLADGPRAALARYRPDRVIGREPGDLRVRGQIDRVLASLAIPSAAAGAGQPAPSMAWREDRHFRCALPRFRRWAGETRMNCMHPCISQTLANGYSHHIQRRMVTGRFGVTAQIHPQPLCDWYLAVDVDAVQWVERPNTAGMARFANGGRFTSRPCVASGAYVKRMNNDCNGCRYSVSRSFVNAEAKRRQYRRTASEADKAHGADDQATAARGAAGEAAVARAGARHAGRTGSAVMFKSACPVSARPHRAQTPFLPRFPDKNLLPWSVRTGWMLHCNRIRRFSVVTALCFTRSYQAVTRPLPTKAQQ